MINMKVILAILMLCVWAVTSLAVTETNMYLDPDTLTQYKIEFIYNTEKYEIHNNINHYPANVIISVKHNKEFYMIDGFSGYFTNYKCYEDLPSDIIRRVKQ